jgi:hypothetical protein
MFEELLSRAHLLRKAAVASGIAASPRDLEERVRVLETKVAAASVVPADSEPTLNGVGRAIQRIRDALRG